MLATLRRSPAILRRIGTRICQRLVHHGPRSAWTCFRTHGINGWIRMRQRWGAAPRVRCPCCGWAGVAFLSLDCGRFVVPQVACPHCGSHERHRALHLFLHRHPPAFLQRPGRVLHFAPEGSVRRLIDALGPVRCLSTDYAKGIYRDILSGVPGPAFVSDIHTLPLRADSVDGVFCLHVLEHVADDRAAIQNLYRVVAPGGAAVLMVPFMMDQDETEEYDAPDPELFDHVRGYSPRDFGERLAPFVHEAYPPERYLNAQEIERYQVPASQVIYVCHKQGVPNDA